ncbi:MAG TPA: helix-turn-helix domain-containing protein, partial [Thermomicrobiales bacterium]|nr:helix-turn-helix domain-containing protein [Thermomicrobiales bacterium]
MRPRTTLGQLIRDRRRALGWTQERLAVTIDEGMTQSDVSRLERDKVGLPRRRRLERLAQALDLPLGELLARSGWTDADQYFGPSSPGERDAGVEQTLLPPGPGRTRNVPRDVTSQRLQDAIDRSHQLQDQTEYLLEQTTNSISFWEHAVERQRDVDETPARWEGDNEGIRIAPPDNDG